MPAGVCRSSNVRMAAAASDRICLCESVGTHWDGYRRPGDGEASRGDPRVLGRFELDLTSAICHFWAGSFFGSIPVPVLGGEVLRPFRAQTAVSSADP